MHMHNENLIKHQLENVKSKANSAQRDLHSLPFFQLVYYFEFNSTDTTTLLLQQISLY